MARYLRDQSCRGPVFALPNSSTRVWPRSNGNMSTCAAPTFAGRRFTWGPAAAGWSTARLPAWARGQVSTPTITMNRTSNHRKKSARQICAAPICAGPTSPASISISSIFATPFTTPPRNNSSAAPGPFWSLASGRPLFELVVHRHLESVCQAIVHVGDADDAQQFAKHGVGHALGDGGGPVRYDTIIATIGHADRQIDQFADERFHFAGATHDFFERRPGSRERRGMIGNGFPEIVDFVCLAGGSDVVKDFPHQSAALFIFDKW